MARAQIPAETQTAVLLASRRRCAICFGLNRDMRIVRGQIAHLDQNAANAALANLAFLCLAHHDEYDSRTSQSKGLTSEEVRCFRDELIEAMRSVLTQPIRLRGAVGEPTVVEQHPQDGVSGRWVRGDDWDSAEIQVEFVNPLRVRVLGFALHGKGQKLGPNIGDIDFESALVDGVAAYKVRKLSSLHSEDDYYTLSLRFMGATVVATEAGEFGQFGVGAHFGGAYKRPEFGPGPNLAAVLKALG